MNAARERKKYKPVVRDQAVKSIQTAMAAWVARIQVRFVEFVSTSGPQNILMIVRTVRLAPFTLIASIVCLI